MSTSSVVIRILVLIVLGTCPVCVLAQTPNPPAQASSITHVVKLSVIVNDDLGRSVNDLNGYQVQVLENDTPRKVTEVATDQRPLAYGLVVDTSGSLRTLLPPVIDTAKSIVNGNDPQDQTFVESFVSSDKIETVQEFTTNRTALLDGLDNLYARLGQSAVIDAVYLAVQHAADYSFA